eukprot:UN14892
MLSVAKKVLFRRVGATKTVKNWSAFHMETFWSVLHTSLHHEIFNVEHFRVKQKITLRPSRKHCSLLCFFVI